MALIYEIFQPFVKNNVSAPAYVQFLPMFPPKASQRVMPGVSVHAHGFCHVTVQVYTYL
jgi:hypothetical protein